MKARRMKTALREKLLDPAPRWQADWLAEPGCEMEAVSPLLSFLPHGGALKWRSVLALGLVVSALAAREGGLATAREVMRRLMWHMNEDSGNIGWGICEAFGEICAQSPTLASEYGRIALSYVRDTGKADNYLEHGPLRQGAYWAVGRLGFAHAPLRDLARTLLLQGLGDDDMPSRGIAAWGLAKTATAAPVPAEEKERAQILLRSLLEERTRAEVLDGFTIREESLAVFAREALDCLEHTINTGEKS